MADVFKILPSAVDGQQDQSFLQSAGHLMDVRQVKQRLHDLIIFHVIHTVGPIWNGCYLILIQNRCMKQKWI